MGFWKKLLGTIEDAFSIGRGNASDKYLYARNAAVNKPGIRYNNATSKWQIAHDGVTWEDTDASTTIKMALSGAPAYTTLQQLVHMHLSAGRLAGGTVSGVAGAPGGGTVTVSQMDLICRTTNAFDGTMVLYRMVLTSGIALTSNALNYIVFDWNGGAPRYYSTTDRSTINLYNQFTCGRCFCNANGTVDAVITGVNEYNCHRRIGDRLIDKYGFEWASGEGISEVGTRYVSVTAGKWYIRNTPLTTPLFTSSAVGPVYFEHCFYHTGGAWTDNLTTNQLGNTQYDNGTNLTNLTGTQWGVYWLYRCPSGGVSVVYGTAAYTSTTLPTAPPTVLPTYISSGWSVCIGRIAFQRNATNFGNIQTAFGSTFSLNPVTDHEDLMGLLGGAVDDHYHFTAAEHTLLQALLAGTTPSNYYGDGSDGAVTLGANLTLTRDMQYTDLNLNGWTVDTNGYWLRGRGTLAITAGQKVHCEGLVGGTTGTGAVGRSNVRVGGSSQGGNSYTWGADMGGSPSPSRGGAGGKGGNEGAGGGGRIGGNGGTPGTPAAAQGELRSLPEAGLGAVWSGAMSMWSVILGGAGGGGGAGDGANAGGAGGSGGGVCAIAFCTIVNSGTISVKGGRGGGSTNGGRTGDGGGGGGGLALVLTSKAITGGGTIDITGGAGGSGNGSGAAGAAGSDGAQRIIYVQ